MGGKKTYTISYNILQKVNGREKVAGAVEINYGGEDSIEN